MKIRYVFIFAALFYVSYLLSGVLTSIIPLITESNASLQDRQDIFYSTVLKLNNRAVSGVPIFIVIFISALTLLSGRPYMLTKKPVFTLIKLSLFYIIIDSAFQYLVGLMTTTSKESLFSKDILLNSIYAMSQGVYTAFYLLSILLAIVIFFFFAKQLRTIITYCPPETRNKMADTHALSFSLSLILIPAIAISAYLYRMTPVIAEERWPTSFALRNLSLLAIFIAVVFVTFIITRKQIPNSLTRFHLGKLIKALLSWIGYFILSIIIIEIGLFTIAGSTNSADIETLLLKSGNKLTIPLIIISCIFYYLFTRLAVHLSFKKRSFTLR